MCINTGKIYLLLQYELALCTASKISTVANSPGCKERWYSADSKPSGRCLGVTLDWTSWDFIEQIRFLVCCDPRQRGRVGSSGIEAALQCVGPGTEAGAHLCKTRLLATMCSWHLRSHPRHKSLVEPQGDQRRSTPRARASATESAASSSPSGLSSPDLGRFKRLAGGPLRLPAAAVNAAALGAARGAEGPALPATNPMHHYIAMRFDDSFGKGCILLFPDGERVPPSMNSHICNHHC